MGENKSTFATGELLLAVSTSLVLSLNSTISGRLTKSAQPNYLNDFPRQILVDIAHNIYQSILSFSMDIQLPSREKPINYRELPIPLQTQRETIRLLRSLCINDNLQKFQETIKLLLASAKPGDFAIEELGEVMMEAIGHDKVGFVSTLLSHGFPIQTCYALEATLYKAKGVLSCYIKEGWDINEPVGQIKPPVLG